MHGFVGETTAAAKEAFFPGYAEVMTRIGRERGWSGVTREQFEAACGPRGHLLVGSPQDVAAKIIAHHKIFGHDRLLLQMGLGSLPHGSMLQAIELLGTKVVPIVRDAIKTETENRQQSM
jgi:alkanesulfonate monooxygenase SsuD/methylene tetrahydromethanopterin reductase-like flavin-dependent oxidoreductase (luciferase family)